MKKILMLATVFMLTLTIVGCGSNKDATDTTKVALNEDVIKDTYTGIDDVYVLKGTTDVDYLEWVLYDTSIIKGIRVDISKVDPSKEGTYKIKYKVTVYRDALDGKKSKSKTETVIIKKKVTIVNKDKAQELADKDVLVYAGKGETVKKSDGSEVAKKEVAPASTATTGGTVVNSSSKKEVKPETTAKPTASSNSSNDKEDDSTSKTDSSHKHTWVDITETVNHPAVTHEEDIYEDQQVCVKDWWNEKVVTYIGQECSQCGYRTSIPAEMDEHMFLNGHSCHNVEDYHYVYHDAVYETRKVKTGTKIVVDKAGWTETKVVGRKCSSCGKTERY